MIIIRASVGIGSNCLQTHSLRHTRSCWQRYSDSTQHMRRHPNEPGGFVNANLCSPRVDDDVVHTRASRTTAILDCERVVEMTRRQLNKADLAREAAARPTLVVPPSDEQCVCASLSASNG